jgi:tetratricopeptide (TPR) repeat protein
MFLNLFFPLLYSLLLFICVIFICIYVIGQIKITQKVEKRIIVLENKLQLNQNLSNNLYILGQIYLRKKFYEKAIGLFRESLVSWDLNDKIGLGSLYNTLGFTYFQLKEYDYAKYYYLQAIKLLPDYTLALTNLGLIYETTKMYLEAYNIYTIVLDYESNNKIALSRITIIEGKTRLLRDGRI